MSRLVEDHWWSAMRMTHIFPERVPHNEVNQIVVALFGGADQALAGPRAVGMATVATAWVRAGRR